MNYQTTKIFLILLLFSFNLIGCKSKKEIASTPDKEWKADIPEPNIYIEPETDSYEDEEYPEIRYEDHVYKSNINSVQLYIKDQPLSYPVVFLNDNKQLQLHFDDLDSKFHTYSYQLVHCNANWQPSGLVAQEFLEGFMSGFINDFQYSFNTLVRYMHYKIEFPNEEIRFKLSGNYIIKVFEDNNPEKLVITRRFFVVDQRVKINSDIHFATLARHRDYKQEIDFTLDLSLYPVTDPYLDLKVVLLQNRRWDNAVTNLKPLFVKTPQLVYNYEDDNLFDGGNEFRFFDTKDLRYQSLNVDGIQIMNNKTHVFILPEEPRSFKRYLSQQDINGRRLIKRDDSQDANRDADYMQTHFTLKREAPVYNGDVYVFGQLSDWQFQEKFKMKYVEVNNEYVVDVLLKQGYYNYSYVVLPKGSDKGDIAVIEGTHSETENDYYFFVYHRKQGEIYDRLVGFKTKNSNSSID